MQKKILTAAQTAVLMAILTLISKLFGFAREMVMANYYGASYVTDAYAMAFTILTVLFGGIIAAISTAYMPIYSKIAESKGLTEGDNFTSRVINLLFLLTIMISILGINLSDQIIAIFASGFTGDTALLASFFVKVLFSYVIFSSAAGIIESYLQYKGVFLPQIICGYLISTCTIIAIVISAHTSQHYLAFGVLVGYALRLAAMLVIVKRRNFHYTLTLKVDSTIKEMMFMTIPTFLGTSMVYINQFVDKTIASRLTEGSIAALNYAWLLNNMIMGVTITILFTIIYPKLTHAYSTKHYERYNELASAGVNIVIIIALPCSLGAMLYSYQIVQVVYERGAFDSVATTMTSSAFFFYSMGLLFMAINDLLLRAYYSMHDMKTPMTYSAIGVIINITLSLIMVRSLEHSGLALATSIASMCTSFLLYNGLRKKYQYITLLRSRKKILQIAAAAVSSIAISFLIYQHVILAYSDIILSRIIQLFLAIVVAAVVYLIFLILLKIDEIQLIKQVFQKSK